MNRRTGLGVGLVIAMLLATGLATLTSGHAEAAPARGGADTASDLRVTATGGVSGHWRIEVPKALIQRPVVFGDIASGEPTKFEFAFSAVPSAIDIAGTPLVGAGGEPVEVLIAELAA